MGGRVPKSGMTAQTTTKKKKTTSNSDVFLYKTETIWPVWLPGDVSYAVKIYRFFFCISVFFKI